MFDLFLSAFISLFVIVDPFGTASVFLSLTSKQTESERKKIAIKAVVIAIGVLIFFGALGLSLLNYIGVSLSAFRIAGGLLLFVTAFRLIMGFYDPDQVDSEEHSGKHCGDVAVFPMAIPMLAGPGSMTAVLMFITMAQDSIEHCLVVISIVLVELIALASLLGASRLSRFFGPTGNGIIARIMGILLAAMAVQFISDGVKELFL